MPWLVLDMSSRAAMCFAYRDSGLHARNCEAYSTRIMGKTPSSSSQNGSTDKEQDEGINYTMLVPLPTSAHTLIVWLLLLVLRHASHREYRYLREPPSQIYKDRDDREDTVQYTLYILHWPTLTENKLHLLQNTKHPDHVHVSQRFSPPKMFPSFRLSAP